jgi:sigma-E factor negative regulatory protein RseC
MNEVGIIVKVAGENVTVQFERKASCENCGMCFATDKERKVELTLKNTVGAGIGDTVRVGSKSSYVLKSLLLVYGVPLVMFFIGLFAADILFHNDIVTFFTGLAFLAVGFVIMYIVDKKIGKAKKNTILPEIIGIEKSAAEETKENETKEKEDV